MNEPNGVGGGGSQDTGKPIISTSLGSVVATLPRRSNPATDIKSKQLLFKLKYKE